MKFRLLIGVAGLVVGLGSGLVAGPARAETPEALLQAYQAEARGREPGFAASAERGRVLFQGPGQKDWRCTTCHTDHPAAMGQHATTAKPIPPLAPAANSQRLTRADKVEKWFRRNCQDVLGRGCTPSEKSDVMAYLIAVKP